MEAITPLPEVPTATSFCDEAIELVYDFESLLEENYLGQSVVSSKELIFAAKKISGMVRRAENNGVDLSLPSSRWLYDLKIAARAFVGISEIEHGTYSESEEEQIAEGILARFDNAKAVCIARFS